VPMGTRTKALRNIPCCHVIGTVRTGFSRAVGTPIQPAFARGARGRVIVDKRYARALDDVEGFERVWLIYWMDRAGPYEPRVVPYRDTRERGLFATRAPCRPNPIGLSAVRLLRREGSVLHVADVDVLDHTPLLDIKPYVPEFDAYRGSRAGWLDARGTTRKTADGRFHTSRRRRAGMGERSGPCPAEQGNSGRRSRTPA
jgi:tRNA-Thr(GGU) m(6)t(6)A37 methyltransferase TsaA